MGAKGKDRGAKGKGQVGTGGRLWYSPAGRVFPGGAGLVVRVVGGKTGFPRADAGMGRK